MAVAIGATVGTALPGITSAGAGAGALLTNPVGWIALGAGLLMQMDAQDKANAQRKKAYEIQTSNLAMQRDIKLSNARREVLAKQDQLLEEKLQNLIQSAEASAKLKSSAKGQMNTGNLLRLIKSGELQNNTKISQAYNDMLDIYDSDAQNVYRQTAAEIERLRHEYSTEDNTIPLLMDTLMGGYQMQQRNAFDLRMTDLQKKMEEQTNVFSRYITANKGASYGG